MTDFDTDRLIGETMAEVFREQLLELETLEATGVAEHVPRHHGLLAPNAYLARSL